MKKLRFFNVFIATGVAAYIQPNPKGEFRKETTSGNFREGLGNFWQVSKKYLLDMVWPSSGFLGACMLLQIHCRRLLLDNRSLGLFFATCTFTVGPCNGLWMRIASERTCPLGVSYGSLCRLVYLHFLAVVSINLDATCTCQLRFQHGQLFFFCIISAEPPPCPPPAYLSRP